MSDIELDFTPVDDDIAIDTSEEQVESQEVTEEETAKHESTEENDAPAEENEVAQAESTPFLSLKYNHESKNFTKEEAIDQIQRSMKNESRFNKLDYVAAQSGKTVDELIESIYNASEQSYREELTERYGDDENIINLMMKEFHQTQQEKYDKVLADRQKEMEEQTAQKEKLLNERLADELVEVQNLFPNIKEFNDIPESVRNKAIKENKDLTKEYLLYLNKENQKKNEAAKNQEAAKQKSTGSVSSAESESSTVDDALLKGVWSRF